MFYVKSKGTSSEQRVPAWVPPQKQCGSLISQCSQAATRNYTKDCSPNALGGHVRPQIQREICLPASTTTTSNDSECCI